MVNIQKPFHFDVLIAKIQAILRRVYNYNNDQVQLKRGQVQPSILRKTWCPQMKRPLS